MLYKVVPTMPRKQRKKAGRKKVRSPDQQAWAAAVGHASQTWEQLTDEQRLELRVQAGNRRMTGQRWFVKLNARRFYNGQPLLLGLPGPAPVNLPLRFRFFITNLGGRVAFKLEFLKAPIGHFTVWASRPRNRGTSREKDCPRLGSLPELEDGVSDFTELYFRKHGAFIRKHRLRLVGKRIFIRLRQELDEGPGELQGADAVVPTP